MRYLNASDILPDELLREIQKYTQGEAIYIPREQERRKWGGELRLQKLLCGEKSRDRKTVSGRESLHAESGRRIPFVCRKYSENHF